MSAGSLPGVQGGIVWALVPFESEAPFRVRAQAPQRPIGFATVRDLAEAVRDRVMPPQFELGIGAKLRPVLLLQDRPRGRLPEHAALKLTRLSKLARADRAAIREQRAARFFHIDDPGRFGLDAAFAVDLLSLVRVHRSAIVGPPRGRVNVNEFRVICERMVGVMDLDVAHLVAREAHELLRRRAAAGDA